MMLYVYNTISITLTVLFVQFTYFYKFQVESAIVAKVMSTGVNIKPSEKFARTLALLPSIPVSEDSWSLMIQRILIVVNNLLNDAFVGLEEGKI